MPELTKDLSQAFQKLPQHLLERSRFLRNDLLSRSHAESIEEICRTVDASSPVIYWTHHALRADENPALDVACYLARSLDRSLAVVQWISQKYRFASDRHHTFLLQGAKDLHQQYMELGIPFAVYVETDSRDDSVLRQLAQLAAIIVTDDFPGEPTNVWTETLAGQSVTPIIAVDTACVVPMQVVGKAYDRAFAFRDATADEYRSRVPLAWPVQDGQPRVFAGQLPEPQIDWEHFDIASVVANCKIDHSVGPVADTRGGSGAGYERWAQFKRESLKKYASRRNDPCSGVASRMSAYLHYGMVSPMRLAREANELNAEKYLEELLVWRELAYAYCFYRDDYETIDTIPAWARVTLQAHTTDPRPVVYSWETLARGRTEDRLWNACQRSLLKHGELHNNVRMTWGKAVLNWTVDAPECLRRLIDLNHRYALDGRDPASYGGILWCLGQFDRPFQPEQPITGTVRGRSTQEHAQRMDMDQYESLVDRPIFARRPKIAIVGSGLGGLMCARGLQDHGLEVTLFEKSRGPGGRSATRRIESALQFDHGAQYFTCKDPRIARYVESWVQDGIVQPWHGRFAALKKGNIERCSDRIRFVGTPTMSVIGRHLAEDLRVVYQSTVTQVKQDGQQYQLFSRTTGAESDAISDRDLGVFDAVVWNSPPVQTSALVPSNCSWREQLKEAKLAPCWTVMFALESEWKTPFDALFINDTPSLGWLARNSSKPKRSKELDCWVLHSSREWAAANLGMSADDVSEFLLSELRKTVSIPMPETIFRQGQRWLYASALSRLPSECAWDADSMLGACGDWFQGENVEGALLSGMALAGRILGTLNQTQAHEGTASGTPQLKQLKLFS